MENLIHILLALSLFINSITLIKVTYGAEQHGQELIELREKLELISKP